MLTTFQDITLRPMPKAISNIDIVKIFSMFRIFNACHLPFPSGDGGFKSLSATILASNILKGTPLNLEDALLPKAKVVQLRDNIEETLLAGGSPINPDSLPNLFVVTDNIKPLGWVHIKHLMTESFLKGIPRVGRVMRQNAVVIDDPDCSLYEIHRRIQETRETSVIISDGPKVLGVVDNKTVSRLVSWGCDIWHMKAMNVARPVPAVKPTTSLQDAYMECIRNDSEQAVVLIGELPVGTITLTDIVNALWVKSQGASIPVSNGNGESGLHENAFLDIVVGTSMNTGILGLTEHLRVVYFNNTLHHMLGDPPEIRIGTDISMVSEACNISVHKMLTSIERSKSGEEQTLSAWKKKGNEQQKLQFKINAVRIEGKEAGYVIAVQDVTDQYNAQRKMQRLAYYDSLTNLPNRSLFKERFQTELHKAQREKNHLAIMMMDLDGFKEVNDTFGHSSGDVLLNEVGKRLKTTIRETDTVGRFGGDEFVFIFPQITNRESAEQVADKLLEAVAKPMDINGETMRMGASIGIAIYPEDGTEFKELLDVSDSRMFFQKRLKREEPTLKESLPGTT